jgi:7,8-dihydropterin-6-yl-methyl-4-(beta-D-ribofuranosyl)aminobenzene 5'-phosphate synthase
VCKESATADDVRAAMPHPVAGSAADPIALEPVDDVVITTLVDNVYDALLTSDDSITRAPFSAGTAQAPQFESGRTNVGLVAEHGFSAVVTVRRGDTTTSVLFDTGLSPDAMVTNADRLGLDLSGVHAVVLSHGHFDHVGGMAGLAGRRGTQSLPMVVHPLVWTRRRLALPGGGADDWPTLRTCPPWARPRTRWSGPGRSSAPVLPRLNSRLQTAQSQLNRRAVRRWHDRLSPRPTGRPGNGRPR